MMQLADSARPTSLIMAQALGNVREGLIEAAQARWAALDGLEAAAIHKGLVADDMFEFLRWRNGAAPEAALDVYRDYSVAQVTSVSSNRAVMVPGPAGQAAGFSLMIDPAASRPMLLSIMRCAAERQDELLSYLTASAERFRTVLPGWTGASLFVAADRSAIGEYLQFESPEAMMALQGLKLLEEHKARLLAFGELSACVALPVAVWENTANAANSDEGTA